MVEKIAKDILHPSLKLLGFKKQGLTWNRTRGDLVDVIRIQKSQSVTASRARPEICVNLAIAVPELVPFVSGKRPAIYNEGYGLVRGRLLGSEVELNFELNFDRWWSITEDNAAQIGGEIRSLLLNHAIPLFDRYENIACLSSYFEKRGSDYGGIGYLRICRAILYWKLGEIDRCEEMLAGETSFRWPEKVAEARAWMKLPPIAAS